jgi:hypothetical protein
MRTARGRRRTRSAWSCGWCATSVAVILCSAWSPALARAQDVAGSGMGQGQANINVRSDVTLGIKGLRSTTTERLSQLTEVVSGQMPELRKCYRTLIAKRPTSVGSIGIRITIEQGGDPPALELKENGGSEPDLTSCVQRVLSHASFRKVGRPAAAAVTLEFENSRAKGEREMAERKRAAEQVEVHAQAGGGYEASWAAPDGKVAFAVRGESSREAVEAVLRTLRSSFASFADCRRRSQKDGLSPAGVLEVEVQLQGGGKGTAKISSSTVAHPRAVPCTEHVLRALRFAAAPAGQRVQVQITFGAQ